MMKDHCLVCGNKDFEAIYDSTLLKCRYCGFVTANLSISEAELKEIYTENYFKGEEYADYLRDKGVLQKNFNNRLEFIFSKFDRKKLSNVLEIGCAYGFFAQVLNEKIKGAEFVGLDIAAEAVRYGKETLGQNLKCEDHLQYPPPHKKYTDTFMWDVIEHLPDPEKVIKKVSDETERGGRIYITTGDIDTLVPRFKKQKWRMIHPPSHLHYFSKKTISLLLEKNGFEVKYVKYPAVLRSMKLVFYALFMLKKKENKLISGIYNRIPEKWYFPFNSFDIMFVIAEKK